MVGKVAAAIVRSPTRPVQMAVHQEPPSFAERLAASVAASYRTSVLAVAAEVVASPRFVEKPWGTFLEEPVA